MMHNVVRKAQLRDLEAIKRLADQHRDELGFVLRPALEESIKRDEVFVAVESKGVIGFLEYHHRLDEQTTLYHIAVSPWARRKGVGRLMFSALEAEAKNSGKSFIQLKCPKTLPANEFYARLGCRRWVIENGKLRDLIVWRKQLDLDQ